MSEHLRISVIIPCYNAESHLKNCLDVLTKQDFAHPFEVIMVDDASTDNTQDILKKWNLPHLRLLYLPVNSGPAAARNLGIEAAKGEFILFLDVDDRMDENSLSALYAMATENACDMVMSDRKYIENSQNQAEGVFLYSKDRVFEASELTKIMRDRFFDPMDVTFFALTGKLYRRSVISENKIRFEPELRYLEDESFVWDIVGYSSGRVGYVRGQLYSYYAHPNVNTALSEGINRGFSTTNFKLALKHVVSCLRRRGFPEQEVEKLGDQGLIYFVISALVSYSRSMLLGKVELKNGLKCRKKMIRAILADSEVAKAVRNYTPSPKESPWIPKAIALRSRWLLELACSRRAKEILRIRRKANGGVRGLDSQSVEKGKLGEKREKIDLPRKILSG